MIIRLARFPLADEGIDAIRDEFARRAEETFTANDDLDREIRSALHAALFQDRH